MTGRSPRDARAISVRTVDYVADGLAMRGHLALPAGAGPHPGVLVFPEGYGLSDQAILRAERIASEMGYVALACDLHGEARELSGLEEVLQKLEPLQRSSDCVRERVVPAYEALLAQPEVDPAKIGAIGFCFGGTMALELALTGRDIGAVVGFHSGLASTAPQDAPNIKAAILLRTIPPSTQNSGCISSRRCGKRRFVGRCMSMAGSVTASQIPGRVSVAFPTGFATIPLPIVAHGMRCGRFWMNFGQHLTSGRAAIAMT